MINHRNTTMTNNKQLSSIFLIVFIDLLGFSLILPLLPYYAETFGASPFITGLLVAVYAAAQLIGAPLLGRLSDRLGRRPVLLVSIAGNLLGFVILAMANSLWILFLARILAGLTGGNISVAQAYISDVTDQSNRAKGLGLIGAAFGLGFIIGPALGGILSKWGFAVPALLAAALSLLNLVLVWRWLPESLTPEKRAQLSIQSKPSFSIGLLFQTLRRPVVGPLLHTRFFYGMAFTLLTTIFPLFGQMRFDLDSTSTGYVLAYVGLLSTITQGFLIGKMTKRFSESNLIFWAVLTLVFAMLGWALAPSIAWLLVVMAPVSVAGGVLNTVINSALSKAVTPGEVGGTLGLSSSLEALTRVISPSIGGLMLERLGTAAPGLFAAAILALLTVYVGRTIWHKHSELIAQAAAG